MKYKVYIMESLRKSGTYYIGHTRDLENRIIRHNRGLVRSTKNLFPWKIIHVEDFESKKKHIDGSLK